MNGTKIAKQYRNTFWDPFVGVPSTVVWYLKGGTGLTAERWLVDRDSSLALLKRKCQHKGNEVHPSLVPPCSSCMFGLFTSECANAKRNQCILKLCIFTHTMLRFLLCVRMMLIATFRHTPCLTSKDTVGGGKASLIMVYHPKSILYCCYIWYMGKRMGEDPHANPFNKKQNKKKQD